MEAGDRPPKAVALKVPWQVGAALARRSRVHEKAGNPWGLWNTIGRPRFPDRETVNFLKLAAHPSLEIAVLHSENGSLNLKFSLERNEVTLIELSSFFDESEGYLGLDDSLIDGYAAAGEPPVSLS